MDTLDPQMLAYQSTPRFEGTGVGLRTLLDAAAIVAPRYRAPNAQTTDAERDALRAAVNADMDEEAGRMIWEIRYAEMRKHGRLKWRPPQMRKP